MALLWSKKSKAEKNYGEETRKVTVVPTDGEKRNRASKPLVETKKAVATKAGKISTPRAPSDLSGDAAGAILRPHVTEKSGLLSQSGVYTFQITRNTNKIGVAKAVKTLYKVTPIKVAIINSPSKNVFVKNRRGVVPGTRKAMVTVKKGEKIDFV